MLLHNLAWEISSFIDKLTRLAPQPILKMMLSINVQSVCYLAIVLSKHLVAVKRWFSCRLKLEAGIWQQEFKVFII